MKKILFTLWLCTIELGFAQLSPKLTDRFPAHILYNVQELQAKIPLTDKQQIDLAARLLRNDSIANANKKILTPQILKNLCSLNKNIVVNVLEEKEYNTYLYQEDKNNRLLLALVNATQLKLNAEQYAAIQKQLTKLENPTTPKPTKIIPYYRQKLDSILDKKQSGMLTYYVYIDESKNQTNQDWQEINQLQLIKNQDPKKAYAALLNYNTARNVFLDEAAEKIPSRIITDVKQKFITDRQPLFLMHKNIVVNNEYKNNLFAIAVRNEKQLELTAPQVDSLLVKCKAVEQMKNEQKTNAPIGLFPFVNKNIAQILTPKQIQIVLTKKNEAQANSYALERWKTIEQQNWTAGLDKNQTIRDFRIYKLKSLVANDKLKIDNNQSNLFMRRDVETNKPDLLKKLDDLKAIETNTKSTKNALKW